MNTLAWIWTHYREVESDMSVLHRIDNSRSFPDSAVWFQRAEQLVHYQGAVRAAGMREAHERQEPAEPEFDPKSLPWVRGPIGNNWGTVATHVVVSDDPPEANLTDSDQMWLDSVDVHDSEVSDA